MTQRTFWFKGRLWFILLFAWQEKTSTKRRYHLLQSWWRWCCRLWLFLSLIRLIFELSSVLVWIKWCDRAFSWISRCFLFQEKMKLFLPSRYSSLNCEKTFLFAQREITSRSSSSSPLYLLSPPITMMTSPPDNKADWNVKRHNSTYFHTICNFQCFVAGQCVCISHVRHT